MNSPSTRHKAESLLGLHTNGTLLVLPNVWDAIGVGVVGVNLEDSGRDEGALRTLDAQCRRIAAARETAARVAVTNAPGQFVEIDGRHPHVHDLDKRWCYVDGAFSLNVPEGGAGLEIRRGLATRPEAMTLAGGGQDRMIQRTLRLRRWVDMRQ